MKWNYIYKIKKKYFFFLDDFIVETVVSSNEMVSDVTNIKSFSDETPIFENVGISKEPIELHNAYIAAGTLAVAIFIVAIVVCLINFKLLIKI